MYVNFVNEMSVNDWQMKHVLVYAYLSLKQRTRNLSPIIVVSQLFCFYPDLKKVVREKKRMLITFMKRHTTKTYLDKTERNVCKFLDNKSLSSAGLNVFYYKYNCYTHKPGKTTNVLVLGIFVWSKWYNLL